MSGVTSLSRSRKLDITRAVPAEDADLLRPEALEFVEGLVREFTPRLTDLLQRRAERQREIDAGRLPDFLSQTADVRRHEWTVGPIPKDLRDRRVEITGPTDRKMIINALNSGANVFMADFEDANSPTWPNVVDGQRNLRDAVKGIITYTSPEGKQYALSEKTATLHGPASRLASAGEARLLGRQAHPGLAFGLRRSSSSTTPGSCWKRAPAPTSTCRSWKAIWRPGSGTTCSSMAQDDLGIPRGSDPRHGADRDHSRRLRDGRDPLRTSRALGRVELRALGLHLQHHQEVPQASRVHHARPGAGHHDHALHACPIRCWRSRPAIAGASTPSAAWPRRSPSRTIRRRTTRPWKRSGPTRSARRATATTAPGWPIPAWWPIAKAAFDAKMPQPNQIDRRRDDVQVTADDLLTVPAGEITETRAVPQHRRGHPIHGRLAGGQRLRADLQPHGRCGHGRNLPGTDSGSGSTSPTASSPTAGRSRPELCPRAVPGADGQTAADWSATEQFRPGKLSRWLAKLIEGIVLQDEFTEFMTLVGYEHLD